MHLRVHFHVSSEMKSSFWLKLKTKKAIAMLTFFLLFSIDQSIQRMSTSTRWRLSAPLNLRHANLVRPFCALRIAGGRCSKARILRATALQVAAGHQVSSV